MHALRQIHRALAPGGILLDMHPVPPATRAEVGGVSLGDFDDAEFFEIVRATEKPLADSDLFVFEDEVEFEWLERFDSGEQLLEDVKEWEGCRVPPALARAIREAKPPVDIWERVVLRRFRAAKPQDELGIVGQRSGTRRRGTETPVERERAGDCRPSLWR